VHVRIVVGGREQFFAWRQSRAKALLLLREDRRPLPLPIVLLPKVSTGQECSPAEQSQ
jgi:hypothetical protein